MHSTYTALKRRFWNQLIYKKDSTEYTGLEYWINDKVEKENITWFPIEDSEESNVEQNLNDLNEQLDEILDLANKKLNV
jgi:inositol 1,4,5-triphosphate receptor type 1/inositol 1,4,5-triphosphate receptor type 3